MKCLCCYLVVALVVIGIAQRVFAGFSPSEAIFIEKFDRSSDLIKVQKVLEMKMVGERLKELGFTPNEIQGRLDQLSDEQLHQLALHLDELQVGGDGGWIAVILLIAILVVLIYYLSGYRLVSRGTKR